VATWYLCASAIDGQRDALRKTLPLNVRRIDLTRVNRTQVRQAASDVYCAVCDVEHMKKVFPDEQLNFFTDFSDDVAERRAAEILANEAAEDDDDEAA
jgi:hypothetical protein